MARFAVGAAITLHFGLMLLQVSPLRAGLPAVPGLAEFARIYRALTFANRNFRFFAPTVADDLVLRISLHHAEPGTVREFELAKSSPALALRVRAMLDHFADRPAHAERFARAWAHYALADQPQARSATIEVWRVVIPGLQAYRRGARATQHVLYRGSFER